MRNFIESKMIRTKIRVRRVAERVCNKLKDNSGNFIEEMAKYIIGIVLAALILAGLYALVKNVVLPAIGVKVENLFNYSA